jgi:primosomal protein N' (replication factor Y)
MGVSPAFVSKIKQQYRWKLLVKCNEEEPLKLFVLYCIKKLRENDPQRKLTDIAIHLSLDPALME